VRFCLWFASEVKWKSRWSDAILYVSSTRPVVGTAHDWSLLSICILLDPLEAGLNREEEELSKRAASRVVTGEP
jgi:hypothetical protein